MKYSLFIPFVLTIAGCASGSKTGDSQELTTSVKQDLQGKSTVKLHKPEQLGNKPQRKWLFNSEEFIVQGRIVAVGANVYNVTLKQYGVIQEHLYVTLQPEVSEAWLRKFIENDQVRITANTSESIYRLTFKPEAEIFTLYQRLDKAQEVKSAEISVFYNSSDLEVM